MWKKYKGRVLIACSAQAFAQLVRFISLFPQDFFRGAGENFLPVAFFRRRKKFCFH